MLICVLGALGSAFAQTAPMFDRDVKPLLARRCGSCHSAQTAGAPTRMGGLAIDTVDTLFAGGAGGPAIVPGKSAESLLLQYVRGEKKPQMPFGQEALSRDEIAVLARWVDTLPPRQPTQAARPAAGWPFAPLVKPAPPAVKRRDWVKNPIDAFLLAKLEQKDLSPTPPASRRALLRRLYFDLVGMPPTPADMDRFLSDQRAEAYEREIEKLLADPRYGERWARRWLDVVRYADTAGGGSDAALPHMWRYRDYVIRAFNQDRPYDRFIREQFAGDAYPAYGAEGRIGTGFLRLGVALEGSAEETRREMLTDVVDATGSVFLGLTLGCARCHDHKFAPIPTRDYYRMEAFFAPLTLRADAVGFTPYERGAEWTKRGKPWEEALARRKQEDDKAKAAFRERLTKSMSLTAPQDLKDMALPSTGIELIEAMRKGLLFDQKDQDHFAAIGRRESGAAGAAHTALYKPMAYVATELIGARGTTAPNYPLAPTTYVLKGGSLKLKGEAVQPGFLSAVTGHAEPVPLDGLADSPRELLAEWIASPENPLTARVMVNRIWQGHFGRGLVATPSDFGKNGSGTDHPQLLDWLASEFIEAGWSVKAMHRLILRSNAWQQATHHPAAARNAAVDAENRLWWRSNPIRLDAEVIRDTMLAVSGKLNSSAGGPGFFPDVDEEQMKRADTWWEPSPEDERNRRSIYMFQKRALTPSFLHVFDSPNMNESCPARSVTTVTPQVFALFNSPFAAKQASEMAARVAKEVGDVPEAQVKRAFELALQRPPSEQEKERSLKFLAGGSLADFCLVLFNLNEFISVE